MRSALVHGLFGFACALLFQWGVCRVHGKDLSFLLTIGESAPPFFREELGRYDSAPLGGHDGQFSYIIARDPWLSARAADIFGHDADLLRYRYHRALFSWLGGGFGRLRGRDALYGLVVVNAFGVALTWAALGFLIAKHQRSPLWLLAAAVNPGFLQSLEICSADNLAAGLSLSGVALYLYAAHSRRRFFLAACLFAFAGLTKEYYLVFPLAAALIELMRQRWRAALGMACAAIPFLMWSAFLAWRLGASHLVLRQSNNFTWPLAGIRASVPFWVYEGGAVLLLNTLMVLVLLWVIASYVRFTSLEYRLLTAPWTALGFCGSHWIWNVGTSATRVLAPLLVLAVLPFVDPRLGDRKKRRLLPTT